MYSSKEEIQYNTKHCEIKWFYFSNGFIQQPAFFFSQFVITWKKAVKVVSMALSLGSTVKMQGNTIRRKDLNY